VSERIKAGSRFKRFLFFVSSDVRSFRIPHVSAYSLGYVYPRLKTTVLEEAEFE
jgi:hypothetical protein